MACFMIRDPVGADDLFRSNVKWLDRTEVADLYHTGESDDVYIIKLLCGGARPKKLVKMINEDKRPYYRRFGKKF